MAGGVRKRGWRNASTLHVTFLEGLPITPSSPHKKNIFPSKHHFHAPTIANVEREWMKKTIRLPWYRI